MGKLISKTSRAWVGKGNQRQHHRHLDQHIDHGHQRRPGVQAEQADGRRNRQFKEIRRADQRARGMESFRCGRDFAAWLGLVPLQRSTDGKQILGKTSKMGQCYIRRLLIVGVMAVVGSLVRRGAPKGSGLDKMLARKPRMLIAIALANKIARGLWAMLTKNEEYWGPVMVG